MRRCLCLRCDGHSGRLGIPWRPLCLCAPAPAPLCLAAPSSNATRRSAARSMRNSLSKPDPCAASRRLGQAVSGRASSSCPAGSDRSAPPALAGALRGMGGGSPALTVACKQEQPWVRSRPAAPGPTEAPAARTARCGAARSGGNRSAGAGSRPSGTRPRSGLRQLCSGKGDDPSDAPTRSTPLAFPSHPRDPCSWSCSVPALRRPTCCFPRRTLHLVCFKRY